MSIDVVCVNYRTSGDLGGFLRSFEAHRPADIPTTITIVNVAPRADDTAVATHWVTRLGVVDQTPARLIELRDNVGYARAGNFGASTEEGEVVAVFNADVELWPGTLEECHDALIAHPEWGVLGPKQVDGSNRITHAGIFGLPERPRHRGWQGFDNGTYNDVRDDAVYVSGSALFVRRAVWDELTACPIYQAHFPEALGPLPLTPLFYEDSGLCAHARGHGYKVTFFGISTATHKWHRSVRANNVDTKPLMDQSREMFRAFLSDHSIDHE